MAIGLCFVLGEVVIMWDILFESERRKVICMLVVVMGGVGEVAIGGNYAPSRRRSYEVFVGWYGTVCVGTVFLMALFWYSFI